MGDEISRGALLTPDLPHRVHLEPLRGAVTGLLYPDEISATEKKINGV